MYIIIITTHVDDSVIVAPCKPHLLGFQETPPVTYLAKKIEAPTIKDMQTAFNIVAYIRTTGVYSYVYNGTEILF
jgi:hypothetical protein